MANILRCTFDSKVEWPARDVTVYEDRAQIVRILDYKTTDAGEAELKLTNLPTSVVADSVRAEVASTNATVLEVTSERVTGKPGKIVVTERETEIAERLMQLEKEGATITARKQLLQTYYDSMVPSAKPKLNQNKLFESFSSADNLSGFSESLSSYSAELQKLISRETEIRIEKQSLHKERGKIQTEKVQKSQETAVTTSEISVLLNVPEDTVVSSGIVAVKVTYVVNSCSWTASYDTRVNKEENVVDLAYYGQVVNGSGEDWQEVQMFLSTAKPSRAGELPPLGRANVKYIPKETFRASVKQKKKKGRRRNKNLLNIEMQNEIEEEDDDELSLARSILYQNNMIMEQRAFIPEVEESELMEELEEIAKADQTVAEDRGGSATFKLTRLCSIESDNVPHKQKISSVVLKPLFTYVISPEKSSTPYLRCSAKNDSAFIFVKGKMNVFFNGSFVTSTTMKLVNKNQEFKVFLGKDESVKVSISPQVSKKETTKGGLMSSKVNKETFTQKLNIENTREEEVTLLIYGQLPRARDNKIKVEVLAPNITKDKKNELYKINYMNHLEVKRRLKPGRIWEYVFTYKVEWPTNTDLVYTESLENMER